mmetsp:Transcript_16861/g.34135  ORF Transcript_16861/g.34135 Transcript_16861/m.34135 type:complete len:127 (-) Transcript_16861:4537-4917(-)
MVRDMDWDDILWGPCYRHHSQQMDEKAEDEDVEGRLLREAAGGEMKSLPYERMKKDVEDRGIVDDGGCGGMLVGMLTEKEVADSQHVDLLEEMEGCAGREIGLLRFDVHHHGEGVGDGEDRVDFRN